MKTILMSIRPQWVAKILNGEKTIEIRKTFPSDYVGWVYIYCTKEKPYITGIYNHEHKIVYGDIENKNHNINGKVVARFWCDKVEEIKFDDKQVQERACLTEDELFDYLFINTPYQEDMRKGYAWHIDNLEIFDKPKEISEFKQYKKFSEIDYMLPIPKKETCERLVALNRAPQSWCYLEI